MSVRHRAPVALLAVLLTVTGVQAQTPPDSDHAPNPYRDLKWQAGPGKVEIGRHAELTLPEGYMFLGERDAKKFMELSHNLPGDELGILAPIAKDKNWWATFEFLEIGYVADSEKDKLDADAILKTIVEGTARGNEERKKRGWPTMTVVGWHVAPAYDPESHNLQWSIEGRASDSEGMVINQSTRVLGREGVMSVGLVSLPEEFDAARADLQVALKGYSYKAGKRYFEFREGDKVAAVGLTGLIVGGAAVAAVKSGFLAKFLKPLLLALIAFGAAIAKWFRGLFGGRGPARGDLGPGA